MAFSLKSVFPFMIIAPTNVPDPYAIKTIHRFSSSEFTQASSSDYDRFVIRYSHQQKAGSSRISEMNVSEISKVFQKENRVRFEARCQI